jgi:hypothetical protein
LLADNPTLMRLRELEVLESIAKDGTLSVVLGENALQLPDATAPNGPRLT